MTNDHADSIFDKLKAMTPPQGSFLCSAIGVILAFVPEPGWVLGYLFLACAVILAIITMARNQVAIGVGAFICSGISWYIAAAIIFHGIWTDLGLDRATSELDGLNRQLRDQARQIQSLPPLTIPPPQQPVQTATNNLIIPPHILSSGAAIYPRVPDFSTNRSYFYRSLNRTRYPYMGTLLRGVQLPLEPGQTEPVHYPPGSLVKVTGPDKVVSGDNTPLPVTEADVRR